MIQSETLDLLEWPRLCQHLATFASTKLGAIAAQRLKLPGDRTTSERLLAQTGEVYTLESRLPSGLNFGGIQDIWQALELAERQGVLSGDELLAIANTLYGARQLRRAIDAQDDLPTLTALISELRTHADFEKEIHRCIDDRGEVTDRASSKLAGIRTGLKQVRDQIYQKLQQIIQRNSGALQEPLITQRSDRFVIPVKAPQKDAIPGIVHDSSTTGATLYIEPQRVIELGNRLRQLQRQEHTEVEKICRILTEKVAEILPDIEHLLLVVTTLDLAAARARYGIWLQANPPRFVENDTQTTLRQLRHPLLVWQAQYEDGPTVVPIDLLINPAIRVVAITGPNTGGKTVTLKTLGLATLMAKAGLFVPAREPVEIPWFDQVLADIGDEQSIEQSLSTFSGHVRRIGRILEAIEGEGDGEMGRWGVGELAPLHALSNALILLDEVGAGTDPSEGSALAIALLQHLANQARLTVATTHFGELKALKYQDERFENASVEFDDVSLSPTYRLLWGIPGRSNALTIARRLGLDETVLTQAEQYVGVSGQQDVNEVIAGLEDQRRRQETKAEETARLLAEAEKLHDEVARKAAFLKTREQELQQQQELAIQQAIAAAKAEIAQVIRQLQQGNTTGQDAQKATAAVDQIAQKRLPSQQKSQKKAGFKPKVGDRVRIPSLGQTAEVLTDPDVDGKLTVRFGLMKMTVALRDLESLTGEKAEDPAKAKSQNTPPSAPPPAAPTAPAIRTSKNTVDLRGKRVVEAEVDLEEAIAHANGPLWIIHGHGTGKLKRGVHEFLKRHPLVARFEAAEQADGGTGVTVVHLA
ncbi:MAG: endonuclease MutS2 [Cyanobacteria bacterium P01_A01_bin.123]